MAQDNGSEMMFDPQLGSTILNETTVPTDAIMGAMVDQHPELASLVRWSNQVSSRSGSLFERDKYLTPRNPFEQMKVAYEASQQDDVVAGVLETAEALAFGRLDFDAETEDEEDVWEQIAEDLELEDRLREMWRELFTVSQFYAATFWGTKTYKLRGRSLNGVKRKKTYASLRVPIAISLLDPLKIVPVGNFMFGRETLAYIATRTESEHFEDVLAGRNTTDMTIRQLVTKKYTPDAREKKHLSELDIKGDHLYELNPKVVWRHTETRPSYERFANVRMKSVFELLDLKRQLREMDRAHLIGGTNFIVLVKKGTDDYPARPAEIQSLAAQVKASARVPVIVGDHRLEVEIITPKVDNTLRPDRYNGLDARLEARLFGMFMTGNFAAGAKGDDSIKLAKVVARGLESRRYRLLQTVSKNIIKPTIEKNLDRFGGDPVNVCFHPNRIALDLDPAIAMLIQDLRDRGDISRETILDEIGLDQDMEARRRQREKDHYDDIFKPVQVPFDSPDKLNNGDSKDDPDTEAPAKDITPSEKRRAGRQQGGIKNGGGANPQAGKPSPKPRPGGNN
jgi:hypothetical protein